MTARKLLLAPLIVLAWLTPPPLAAQEWARKMFKVSEHDFGSVAKGSRQEFAFELENLYEEDLHIVGVQTSCGCTTPTVTKHDLKTWEKSSILAVFNTRTFLGQRSATLTVTIDKPFYAQVQLQIRGYIRSDVVFSPGEIDFGAVDLGTTASKKVQVTYAGRGDWQIRDVQSSNSHFEVELKEVQRAGGRVVYDMLVELKPDAPEGNLRDRLLIVTDDAKMEKIPLAVTGRIAPALSVSPSPFFLGEVAPDGTATGKLVVKGKQPFKIKNIDCDEAGFAFQIPDKASKVHVIPVTFQATKDIRKIATTLEITTNLHGETRLKCHASVNVGTGRETEQDTHHVSDH
ncbi:MAG: DUF1573 domain-containing protein [Planctomycetes bacterium]|nr:DUF1573 domain-containing protein [Planctomycetota bacterium]